MRAATASEPPLTFEGPAWAAIEPGWRQLYGDFTGLGVSVEEHDFRAAERVDWGRSFHPESLELCLNLKGRAEVRSREQVLRYDEKTIGHCVISRDKVEAWRRANDRHLFLTIELSREFLRRNVSDVGGLLPRVRDFVEGRGAQERKFGSVQPLNGAHESAALSLRQPPVHAAARHLWFQSKVLEIIAQELFAPAPAAEMFCSRQKRVARERVEAAMMLLRQRLQEPPTLDQLSRAVGSSPFHLSRTFSEQTRMSIPLYVRKLRMERAAELLASGGYSVTQAAFEVGYSSLGHFSKSFCEVIGCCPSLYPQAKTLAKARR